MIENHGSPDGSTTGREAIEAVLRRRRPSRIVYAPNYWQWFAHHTNHGTLPEELADCSDQLELIQYLGLDVFSRNIQSNQTNCWFGGLTEFDWDGVECRETETHDNRDVVIERSFKTSSGDLTERQRYDHSQSTLVQEKFTIDDYENQLDAYEKLVQGRRWRFIPSRYQQIQERVGERGLIMAGELYSPLKMLHLDLGAQDTTFLLVDHPQRTQELLARHESAQLDLVRQMAVAGVPSMIAMDNLDAMLHPPAYVEKYSASFYEQASRICHEHDSTFFIHACGQQRQNLKFISSLGVDGLEGIAYPPLGNIELEEAMELSGDRFILTGGISADQTDGLTTRDAIFSYVEDLFERMRPFAHRFMLAASCNTAITTPWETIVHFRDAWREYGNLELPSG